MAGVADYLRAQRVERDTDIENLLKNLSTYSGNQEVLAGLGRADRSKPQRGALASAFNVLGIPGRLVQAGIQEAVGAPNPELQKVSGLDQIAALIRGDIDTSASNLPGLKTTKEDTLPTRLAKMAGSFAIDVATDPLSYVGAPASLSRKAVSQQLFRTASKTSFLDDVLRQSSRGEGLIDDLLKKAPVTRAADVQKAAGIAAAAGTPLDVAERIGRKEIAAQELGNRLGTTLLTRGRNALVKDLEEITGSKTAALSLFKSLPEEVRGGVIITNLLGKPVKTSTGDYVRLTSGVDVGAGPIGQRLAKARQAIGVFGNLGTRALSGKAGDVLGNVKKNEWLRTTGKGDLIPTGSDRLIDYVTVRDKLAKKATDRLELQGRALNAAAKAAAAGNAFQAADKGLFDNTFSDFFFAPGRAFDASVASVPEIAAYQAAGALRKEMNALKDEAVKFGLDIGEVGDPSRYSPLMLTDEAFERRARIGATATADNMYIPEKGRRSFVEFVPDSKLADEIGFRDPTNPEVVFLNAKEVNNRLAERARREATAAGKGAEEVAAAAAKAREFIEDPVQVMMRYGNYVANAASNKRFLDALARTGTVIKDVPQQRRLLREWEAASTLAGLTNLSGEARKTAEARLKKATAELAALTDVGKLDDVKRQIAAVRSSAMDAANIQRRRVAQLSDKVAEASADVAEATPRIGALKTQLKNYTEDIQRSAQELADRQRAARNVRDRLATAQKNLADRRTTEEIVQELYAGASSGAEQAYYREVLDEVATSAANVADRVGAESALQQRLASELEQVKAFRKAAREGGAADIERQVYAYEQAVTKRNNLVQELGQARQARDTALNGARRVEKTIALEQVDNITGLVDNYTTAQKALREFHASNPVVKGMDPAAKAAINAQAAVLKKKAKDARKLLKDTLRLGKSEFKAVASSYADELLKAADKLTDEQFQALTTFTNEEKILSYIDTVQRGARDETVVMQAMGDMFASFAAIRDLIPASAFKKLETAQRRVLEESNLGKLRAGVLREEKQASVMASALADEGYSVIGKSKGTQDLYATSGVMRLMEDVYKSTENPEGWRKVLTEYLDPILLLWKTAVTVGRGPGYTATNLIGGMYMNYLGNVGLGDMKAAANAMQNINKILKRIEKTSPNMPFTELYTVAEREAVTALNSTKVNGVGVGDLFSEFNKRGGFNGTEISYAAQQVAQLGGGTGTEAFRRGAVMRPVYETTADSPVEAGFRRGVDFLMTNRVQRSLNNMAQSSEVLLRFSAFMDGFRRYGDLDAAMDKVHLLHFNYQDLTGFENWIRRFVPFYTWTRNNVPAQLRAVAMQPGKIQRALYANEEFQNAFGAEGDESWLNQVLPEYIDISDGFASKFSFADNNIGFFLKLPFEDINRLFKVEGFPVRGRELAGMLGPFTTPIEMASGVNLQTGAAFSPLGEEVPGYYRALGPLVSKGKEGEVRAPGWLARGLGDLFPQLGTAERLASVAGVPARAAGIDLPNILFSQGQEERALTTALNLSGLPALAGMGVSAVSPRSVSGELARRTKIQSADITKAAAALGVEVDWLREQVKAGVTPERLALLIQSGQGTTRPGQKEYSTLSKERRTKLQDIIKGL